MWPSSLKRTILVAISMPLALLMLAGQAEADTRPKATTTPDPFGTPVMPADPSQVDLGREAYYYHCMPCHGHEGQGLTDDWRQLWVDDHQNCWAPGCHGQRGKDPGFPIPTIVPAVSGRSTTLVRFAGPQDLHDYLVASHPLQSPGSLEADQYWSVTAFLLAENGRLAPEEAIGPGAGSKWSTIGLLAGAVGLLVALVLLVQWASRRRADLAAEKDAMLADIGSTR